MILSSKVLPTRTELVPWTDRRGRLHPLRAAVFTLLLLPGLWIAYRLGAHMLGGRPVNTAIHATGYWAVWLLMASLTVSPAKALAWSPNFGVIRRMIGNAVLVYVLIHLLLYVIEQNWQLATVVSEIVHRIYLTIGFVALLGLLVLGATSTDGFVKTMGRSWKTLHRFVYGIAVLGLIHYTLQSKLDVSQAMLAAGVFTWLMLWRALPAGRDRELLPLLGITLAACLMTVVYEYVWYRFGTRIDPMRVVRGELDLSFGPRPAGQVLMLGLVATGLAALRRLGMTAAGASPFFTIGVYALGSFFDDSIAFFLGWSGDDALPGEPSTLVMDGVWLMLFAVLGYSRWRVRRHWQRHLIDGMWVACMLYNTLLDATDSRTVGTLCAAVIVIAMMLAARRLWQVSRVAAMTMVPLSAVLAFAAVSLLKG